MFLLPIWWFVGHRLSFFPRHNQADSCYLYIYCVKLAKTQNSDLLIKCGRTSYFFYVLTKFIYLSDLEFISSLNKHEMRVINAHEKKKMI